MTHYVASHPGRIVLELRALTLVGILISIVTGTTLGVVAFTYVSQHQPSAADQTITEAFHQVQHNYVEDLSEQELMDLAISGMMNALDPHSGYLNKRDYRDLEANTTGKFGGIGIELGLVDGRFTVVTPIDSTPAAKAGIRAGDRIIEVDGISLKGKRMPQVVRMLRGEIGSEVEMLIQRANVEESIPLSIERAQVRFSSIRSRMLEPGIAYIRISQFQTTTSKDLSAALEKLSLSEPLTGLVLDVRNNPGGPLLAWVEVADLFLNSGLIVSTKGRLKSTQAKYNASKGDELDGAPIALLINSGSASASEVLAGALQDHNRAELIGSQSFGKGSVQSVVPLNSDQALKITTAYYYTPNGRSIHNSGIEPDQVMDSDEESLVDYALNHLKSMHLQAKLEPQSSRQNK